jgi:hypothetical protein
MERWKDGRMDERKEGRKEGRKALGPLLFVGLVDNEGVQLGGVLRLKEGRKEGRQLLV